MKKYTWIVLSLFLLQEFVFADYVPSPGDASTTNQQTEITSLQAIATAITGTVVVQGPSGGSGNPIAISAASLPLPTGAATEATLSSIGAKLSPGTATLTSVASSTTSVSLLASNASRKSLVFYNDSTSSAYVAFGATASSSAFTIKMLAGTHYFLDTNVYTGAINAVWILANGNMRVTELQ